jgi:nicotinamide-nucleotide amidase
VRAEILTIGDELCRGEIIDTNSSWLAEKLWELDVTVGWMTSCRDVEADIRRAVSDAVGRSDLVLVSGGLGPTEDDLTVDVLAAVLGVEPEVHEPSKQAMEARYAAAGYRLTPNNLRQVRAPAGAAVLPNPVGAAPGFEVLIEGVPVACMPGIPREMHAIFDSVLRQRIIEHRERRGEQVERLAKRIYRVFGRGESHIAARLEGLMDGREGSSLHFQVKFPETLVKVVVRHREADEARRRLDELDAELRTRLGHHLYGTDNDSLAAVLGRALVAAGATVATAESCTGGLAGGLITAVAGSSAWYAGGAVTYANAEKVRQLGVRPDTLRDHGAVSEACVSEMAEGARAAFGTDYAVAISGIAGPGGGTEDKPVGTVWLAVAGPGPTVTKHFVWPGARDQIRTLAAYWALALLLRAVRQENDDA